MVEQADAVSGRWIGRFFGTNAGNFVLDLNAADGELTGQARLNEPTVGVSTFDVYGLTDGQRLWVTLAPLQAQGNQAYHPVQVSAAIDRSGALTGVWESLGGTAGNLAALRSERLTQNAGLPPPAASTAIWFEKKRRVPSCAVDLEIFRRLYCELSTAADQAAQFEHARRVRDLSAGAIPPELSALRHMYSVSILAIGENGERVLTLDPSVLAPDSLPKPLRSIEIEIGMNYRLINPGNEASNRAKITLDFSRPSVVDFSNPSSAPTANSSEIMVLGNDSFWVAGTFEKITSTIAQGRLGTGWVHRRNTYDVLLILLGFPLTFAIGVYVVEKALPTSDGVPFTYQLVALIYVVLLALAAFRLLFSAVRWLLPYVELAPAPQPMHRKLRLASVTLLAGILASLAASVVWNYFQILGN